jgi:hypothetical protein
MWVNYFLHIVEAVLRHNLSHKMSRFFVYVVVAAYVVFFAFTGKY